MRQWYQPDTTTPEVGAANNTNSSNETAEMNPTDLSGDADSLNADVHFRCFSPDIRILIPRRLLRMGLCPVEATPQWTDQGVADSVCQHVGRLVGGGCLALALALRDLLEGSSRRQDAPSIPLHCARSVFGCPRLRGLVCWADRPEISGMGPEGRMVWKALGNRRYPVGVGPPVR